ncbi:MAG: hypothetical protein ACD_46C00181G0028 [uncultured bacterium]|nr:MAG: hypothetical protein ACD_46C00181G0028 [uncultured bacterium]
MEAVVIIPARMSATRFPGKPLAKIAGLPMIVHCYLRAKMAKLAKDVFVATCDKEISDEIARFGGEAIMTANSHERASDRTAEAISILETQKKKIYDIVVMLQGDEPLINPDCIDQLIQHHEQHQKTSVFNLTQFIGEEDFYSVNTVKVLTNLQSEILAFSREPIPSSRVKGLLGFKPKKQLGVISFRREALIDFHQLSPTPLEKIESIDMMRFLEYGRSIKEVLTDSFMQGVDTPEDAKKVESHMITDVLYQQYKNLVKN